jgi:hypothetical protein
VELAAKMDHRRAIFFHFPSPGAGIGKIIGP